MKIHIARGAFRQLHTWLHRSLLLGGVALLSCCLYAWAEGAIVQAKARAAFRAELSRALVEAPSKADPLAMAGIIGRLEISRLGLSTMVLKGTAPRTLQNGAGHIAGTALPGQPGNSGIAGHRDSFFRPLRHAVVGDVVTFTTLRGEFRYHVVSRSVVAPARVSVLDSDGVEALTLVTCYPFFFAGPAPQRFIIRAERLP